MANKSSGARSGKLVVKCDLNILLNSVALRINEVGNASSDLSCCHPLTECDPAYFVADKDTLRDDCICYFASWAERFKACIKVIRETDL